MKLIFVLLLMSYGFSAMAQGFRASIPRAAFEKQDVPFIFFNPDGERPIVKKETFVITDVEAIYLSEPHPSMNCFNYYKDGDLYSFMPQLSESEKKLPEEQRDIIFQGKIRTELMQTKATGITCMGLNLLGVKTQDGKVIKDILIVDTMTNFNDLLKALPKKFIAKFELRSYRHILLSGVSIFDSYSQNQIKNCQLPKYNPEDPKESQAQFNLGVAYVTVSKIQDLTLNPHVHPYHSSHRSIYGEIKTDVKELSSADSLSYLGFLKLPISTNPQDDAKKFGYGVDIDI
ncbi:MAG: hypothetical protein WCG27_04880 [Pseudomonadota bacterium]